MKRILSMLLLVCLCAVPAFAEESAESFELEETVWDLLERSWTGEARCVADFIGHETFDEVVLGREHDDDTDAVDPVARVLVDRKTGKVVSYCRTDYAMPAFPATEKMLEHDDRFDIPDSVTGAAALEVSAVLDPEAEPVSFLCALDERTGLYAGCTDHGMTSRLLIMRRPESDTAAPILLAYADLNTNPEVGYDGYLTMGQAEAAGREALRAAFGDDAADHVEADEPSAFVLFDEVLMLDTVETEDEEAAWRMENEMNPIWVIRFLDPRGDLQGAGYVPGCEEAYEYRVVVDALTGAIVEMEGPWSYGVG